MAGTQQSSDGGIPPKQTGLPASANRSSAGGAPPKSGQSPPPAPPPMAPPRAAVPAIEQSVAPKLHLPPLGPKRLTRKERRAARKQRLRPAEVRAEQNRERRKMPSWLVSFIAHVGLLLILALIPIEQIARGQFTLFFGDAGPVGAEEFELAGLNAQRTSDALEIEDSILSPNTEITELLKIKLPELTPPVDLNSPGETNPVAVLSSIPYGISDGLTGRTGAMKAALLSKFGGSAETEAAVERGLQWLKRYQKSDGSWSLIGAYSLGGSSENTTAATAMAINAFLGAGYTHQEGKYQEEIDLALKYLLRMQDKEGFFADPVMRNRNHQLYTQALASIAVIEAYGMTGDSRLRSAANKAVRFAEWSQSKLRGWRYEPREDADLSVTGWFVMVLTTAKMAGLGIDEEVLSRVTEFLDNVGSEENSRYAYDTIEPASLSMTAEGMLCRLYLGWPSSHPALLRAVQDDFLPTRPREGEPEYSVYYWYYAAQVMHHVGGEAWESWNRAMKEVLPAMQVKEGNEDGSWDPSKDVFGAAGGRLYTTCLHLYCLEVYYRHLALYDID